MCLSLAFQCTQPAQEHSKHVCTRGTVQWANASRWSPQIVVSAKSFRCPDRCNSLIRGSREQTRTSGREGGELLQLLQLDKVKCGIAPGNGSNDACFSILCRLRNLACHCFCLNTEQSNTYSAGYAASCQVGNVKSSRGKRLSKSRSRPGFGLSQPLCLGYPLHGMCSINKFPTSKSVLGAQCYVIFASFVAGKLSKAIGCWGWRFDYSRGTGRCSFCCCTRISNPLKAMLCHGFIQQRAAAANEALRKALVRFRIPAEATATVKTQDSEREKQKHAGIIWILAI